MEENNWSIPKDGVIHVPDELDNLINSVGMQLGFMRHSGKGLPQTAASIVYQAEQHFKQEYSALLAEKEERIEAAIKRYQHIVDNIKWHIKTNLKPGTKEIHIAENDLSPFEDFLTVLKALK